MNKLLLLVFVGIAFVGGHLGYQWAEDNASWNEEPQSIKTLDSSQRLLDNLDKLTLELKEYQKVSTELDDLLFEAELLKEERSNGVTYSMPLGEKDKRIIHGAY